MDTLQALRDLGINPQLTEEQCDQFDTQGFLVVENVFTSTEVLEMRAEIERLAAIEGPLGGHEVHIEHGTARLSNLFNKSEAFDRCLACQPTLAAGYRLLGEIQVFSLNARNPGRGGGAQPLHSDVPRRTPNDWRIVNSMVLLDDMTKSNGPTRIVPGSHLWAPLNVPDNNVAEIRRLEISKQDRARFPDDPYAPYPGEVRITAPAGSVAVINGHIWHGGTRNDSDASRQVLHFSVGRRDLTQQLVEREHLTDSLWRRTSAAQKFLLNIEGAEPKLLGYPPLPSHADVWTAGILDDASY